MLIPNATGTTGLFSGLGFGDVRNRTLESLNAADPRFKGE